MSRNLHAELIEAKNKLANLYPWLLAMHVSIPTTPPLDLYVVNNNEDIVFVGQTYTKWSFAFKLPSMSSDGTITRTQLLVYDFENSIKHYIEELNGGEGIQFTFYLLNTEFLSSLDYAADLSWTFDLMSVELDSENSDVISIQLGMPNPLRIRHPYHTYSAQTCNWIGWYRGYECKYTGELGTCGGTRAECRARNNGCNFGAHPGLLNSRVRAV